MTYRRAPHMHIEAEASMCGEYVMVTVFDPTRPRHAQPVQRVVIPAAAMPYIASHARSCHADGLRREYERQGSQQACQHGADDTSR